ncbi:MAG TPA: FAD-dependent oxidoreductase [Acidimicrobiales bacterium]|nr:FAD-dependent oxidoreductase [Acidimicrobiales bacterium]
MAFDESSTIAIVGASLAGLRAAEALRGESFGGRIVMIGAENHLPYDRPPLSKQFLAGDWGLDKLRLRDPQKIEALELDIRLGRSAIALDVEGHSLELDDASVVNFDGLVVATGSHPRMIPGTEAIGRVHVLRSLEDSIALKDATTEPGTRVVVVGAGFIGSEVAATCHRRGAQVTVIEALPVPLQRALGEQMGAACAALHTDNGVELRTGVGVRRLRDDGVELEDGTVIAADVILVGIGVVPTTDWLNGSGLEIRDGVVADANLHAAEDIVVAGDLARWYDEGMGEEVRIEHWNNASEQGMAAARSLLAGRGAAHAYVPVPYFWSDQYDVKIQMLGHPRPEDDVKVVDGSVSDRRFVALYGRDGRLTGALGFSRPRQLMRYRQLLEQGASFDEALAQQPV